MKIDDKEYTIKELTVGEIINITQGSVFFSGPLKGNGVGDKDKSKKGDEAKGKKSENLTDEITDIMSDFKRLMKTCCDFGPEDLVKLTPSQIREIYDGFKKVNSDFLSSLKALGVAEALVNIRDVALNRFSKMLVTLLNQDM
ncbi:MAG: hypothetical protein PVG39_00205 [Desulfobacteraceae bacterium]